MGARAATLITLLLLAVSAGGCAALALPGVASMAAGGAGGAVRAGTEYTLGGTVYRTFALPLDSLHAYTVETLRRLDLSIAEDDTTERGRAIHATASRRTVAIALERLSDGMTRLELVVKRGAFFRDRATASEIVAQLEGTVAEHEPLAASVRGAAGACPCVPDPR